MKKVLIIHTKYQHIGGEDIAVENEAKFLKKNFHVETLYFSNKINNYFADLTTFIRNQNKESMRLLNNKIDKFKPDYIYVHNTWFKGSLGIFKILKRRNIKTYIKLHNFRYFCTRTYSLKKHLDGKTCCGACGIELKKGAFFNKYFSDSYIKSLLAIRFGKKYFNILKKSNFNIVVLTNFHKNFITNLGINEKKVYTIPNHIYIKNQDHNKDNYILYAGRISKEKGLPQLIKSFQQVNLTKISLKIIGDGPLLKDLRSRYASSKIQFLGSIPNEEVIDYIRNSKAVVSATKLFEGQPTLLCEASALGVPSIFPKTGGIEEFLPKNYKLSFKQFDYEDLKIKLKKLENEKLIEMIGVENKEFIESILDEKKIINEFEFLLND
jgi:glycosyltransferase involved in cell wall biosynthesis